MPLTRDIGTDLDANLALDDVILVTLGVGPIAGAAVCSATRGRQLLIILYEERRCKDETGVGRPRRVDSSQSKLKVA